jgi:hypothetical protein
VVTYRSRLADQPPIQDGTRTSGTGGRSFCLGEPSGIYREKGMRWYGRTKHGAYLCRKEADPTALGDVNNAEHLRT